MLGRLPPLQDIVEATSADADPTDTQTWEPKLVQKKKGTGTSAKQVAMELVV